MSASSNKSAALAHTAAGASGRTPEFGEPSGPAGHSLSTALARRKLASAFREAGLDMPDLDARLLVGFALDLDHAGLAAQADCKLTTHEQDTISALAARRLAGEPIARIVGTKEFWSLPLRLNAHTLVPRPETETVVEAALAALGRDGARARPLRILDLGTGSGALLLALLSELPTAIGIGTDVSREALICARGNATTLGLRPRASFVVCDYGAALAGPFDLVVSNPPYIAQGDIAALAPEVRKFDPRCALDGGPDGLDGYRAIATDVQRLLAPNGMLVVELGVGQAKMVDSLMRRAGLASEAPVHDLMGVARALVFRPMP
jgi:release factor glutamine methyltransferase